MTAAIFYGWLRNFDGILSGMLFHEWTCMSQCICIICFLHTRTHIALPQVWWAWEISFGGCWKTLQTPKVLLVLQTRMVPWRLEWDQDRGGVNRGKVKRHAYPPAWNDTCRTWTVDAHIVLHTHGNILFKYKRLWDFGVRVLSHFGSDSTRPLTWFEPLQYFSVSQPEFIFRDFNMHNIQNIPSHGKIM